MNSVLLRESTSDETVLATYMVSFRGRLAREHEE